jgi:hypothetical protein
MAPAVATRHITVSNCWPKPLALTAGVHRTCKFHLPE